VGVVMADGDDLRVALFSDADAADFVHVIDYSIPLEPPPGAASAEMPPSGISPESARSNNEQQTQMAMSPPNPLTGPAPSPRLSPKLAPRVKSVREQQAQPEDNGDQEDTVQDER